MTLEEYRNNAKLNYSQLARKLGLTEATMVRRWCLSPNHKTGSKRHIPSYRHMLTIIQPTDDGYKCAICAGMECDRCDKRMYIDCDITPEYCGIEDDDHFSDGSRFICEDCLTDNEAIGYNNYMKMDNN